MFENLQTDFCKRTEEKSVSIENNLEKTVELDVDKIEELAVEEDITESEDLKEENVEPQAVEKVAESVVLESKLNPSVPEFKLSAIAPVFQPSVKAPVFEPSTSTTGSQSPHSFSSSQPKTRLDFSVVPTPTRKPGKWEHVPVREKLQTENFTQNTGKVKDFYTKHWEKEILGNLYFFNF